MSATRKRKARPRRVVQDTDHTYTVLFEPAAEGGYTVSVPMLPGVITDGDSLPEARARALEAIRGHLKVLRKYRQSIPHERLAALRRPVTEQLRVAVPV